MTVPSSLLLVLACIGLAAIMGFVIWITPLLWFRIRRGAYPLTQAELENRHLREMQALEVQRLQEALEVEKNHAQRMDAQLQETLDKLVSKL